MVMQNWKGICYWKCVLFSIIFGCILLVTGDRLVSYEMTSFIKENTKTFHQSFIVIDEQSNDEDLNGIVESLNDKYSGYTVLSYEPNVVERHIQREFLTQKYPTTVILLCSLESIIQLLNEVRQKRLESKDILWFIFSDVQIIKTIQPLINEGTEVVSITGKLLLGQRLYLDRTIWIKKNTLSFESLGWWQLSEGGQVALTLYRNPLFPSHELQYRNFGQRRIKIVANNYILFFLSRKDENGNFMPWEGVDVNIINAVAKKHNFTYDIVHPPDGKWGGPDGNGTITGLIGVVARHEAQLSIHELTITELRETVIDFTSPYYFEGSTIASKAPELKNQALAVVSPFSFSVWIALILSLFTIGIITMGIHRYAKRFAPKLIFPVAEKQGSKFTLVNYFMFNMFRSLVVQGNKINETHSSLRVLLAVWFLSCIVFNALYAGNLCASFTAPSFMAPIESLLDALDAFKTKKVIPICSSGTSIAYLFEMATYGTHKEIYKYFDPIKSYVGREERYAQAAKGEAVVLTSRTSNIIKTNAYGREKYYVSREFFFTQAYGIALPSGSPMKDAFSKTLSSIVEAGLVELWVKESVSNELRFNGIRGGDQGNVYSRGTTGNTSISLVQLQAAFIILVFGLLLGSISFLVEVALSKCLKN